MNRKKSLNQTSTMTAKKESLPCPGLLCSKKWPSLYRRIFLGQFDASMCPKSSEYGGKENRLKSTQAVLEYNKSIHIKPATTTFNC